MDEQGNILGMVEDEEGNDVMDEEGNDVMDEEGNNVMNEEGNDVMDKECNDVMDEECIVEMEEVQEEEEYEEEQEEFFNLVGTFSASLSLLGSLAAFEVLGTFQSGSKLGCPVTKRERIPVADIFGRLDDRWFRKCYRTSKTLFWKLLHGILEPHLLKDRSSKQQRGLPPNGFVSTSARLSMAIRWFAGGEPADIFQVHGVGYKEVLSSVWQVVDAVNLCPELQIVLLA